MRACLFSHFYKYNYIPNYVIYYLEKLKEIMNEVILLTNERDIKNLSVLDQIGVKYHIYENSGYDFGMYHKYLTQNEVDCEQLFLVNDSMVLFNDLMDIDYWVRTNRETDLLGITDSKEMSYHVQSYFMVMNRRTQLEFLGYLYEHGITESFNDVIKTYEVGFCKHIIERGFEIKSKHSAYNLSNPVIHHADRLVNDKCPMIKRKVIFNQFTDGERKWLKTIRYDFKRDYWGIINKNKDENLNLNYLREL